MQNCDDDDEVRSHHNNIFAAASHYNLVVTRVQVERGSNIMCCFTLLKYITLSLYQS